MLLSELHSFPLEQLYRRGLTRSQISHYQKAGLHNVADVLLLVPRMYEDRRHISPLQEAFGEQPCACCIQVVDHQFLRYGNKQVLKVFIADASATAVLMCFGRNFLSATLRIGEEFYLYSRFSYRRKEWQSSVFDFERKREQSEKFFCIMPIYPQIGKLSQIFLRKASFSVVQAMDKEIEDELPQDLQTSRQLLPVQSALREIHRPQDMQSLQQARQSLAYREFFLMQLSIAQSRKTGLRNLPLPLPGQWQKEHIDRLPFSLTADQKNVLQEIQKDMEGRHSMFRILQGDVGCGKTVVVFLLAVAVAEQKGQTVLMVPTSLLARQHTQTAAKLLSAHISVACLHGEVKAAERQQIREDLREGRIQLLIGTHALLSETLVFQDLRLAVIDEQHRFGVLQRSKLLEQSTQQPDILLMTATPIPRTLALSLLGHISISTIHEMPSGRLPIITHCAHMDREEKVYSFVEKELQKGHQAYFIYPRIEKDKKSAQSMYDFCVTRFPQFRVGIIHSQIEERKAFQTLQEFQQGKIQILVATTVVEVGIDIPNTTCMVIEHAQQFGLATLHQLRGRVGRGSFQSYVFLLYDADLTEGAKLRIKAMLQHQDGFSLSEQDLLIRGPGNLVGIQQSGTPMLHIADLRKDIRLLELSLTDTKKLLSEDPALLLYPKLRKSLTEEEVLLS